MPTELPIINLNPILLVTLFALEIAGVIPDPISELLSLFSGRPRQEASVQVAQRLIGARNPAARLWGIAINRMVKEWDIVISGSGANAQYWQGKFYSQFVNNLTAQGVTSARANAIALHALSRAAQAGAALEDELTQALSATLTINGPNDVATTFDDGIKDGESQNLTGQSLLDYAEKYVYKNYDLTKLYLLTIGQPASGETNFPVVTISDQKCPPPYVYDEKSGLCWITLPTELRQPWKVPDGTPSLGQPDTDGDSITNDLCQQMQANTTALIYTMYQVQQQSGAGSSSSWPQLVASAASVASSLNAILSALPSLAPPSAAALDLAPIVTELKCICDSLKTLAGAGGVDVGPVTAALDSIKDAIASAPGTDVTPIVEQLKKIFTTLDPPLSTYQWLADNGYITSDLLQTVGTGELGSGLITVLVNALRKAYDWYLSVIGITRTSTGYVVKPLGETVANDISALLAKALKVGSEPFYPIIKGLIEAVVAQLEPTQTPIPGATYVDPDALLTKTLVPALILNGVMLLGDYLGFEINEQLSEYVTLASEFIGLREVRELKVGQSMRYGPMRDAEHQAKRKYRQELPGASTVAAWHARGLVPDGALRSIYPMAGLPELYEDAETKAAYRGIQPFILLRLLRTGLFTASDLTEEMTFSGIRPASQSRINLAAPYIATDAERKQLIAALEQAFVGGLISDADLTSNLDSADHNHDRNNLVLSAAKWKLLTAETKKLEQQYAELYKGGIIDDATYRADLAAIGLQPGYIDIIAGVAEAAANVSLQKSNIRDANREKRQTSELERKNALEAFKAGSLNTIGLTAALILAGLTPTQAAAQSATAALAQTGSLRWIYGLQKSPAEATLLRERVAAATDQAKKELLTLTAYQDVLKALKIPPRYINALTAAAAALITPKKDIQLIPVSEV